MTDGWRDEHRVAAARRGVAAARRRLTIVWSREHGKWFVGDKAFGTLLEAENSLTRPTEGE